MRREFARVNCKTTAKNRTHAADAGSTDANNAVVMGIPAVSIGAAETFNVHRLEEYADASTMVPGIKRAIALAVALTTH